MGWFFELAKLQCCYHFIKNVGDLPMIKKINFPVLTEMWNMLDLHFCLLICVVLFSQFIWFDKAADLNGICPDFCHCGINSIVGIYVLSKTYEDVAATRKKPARFVVIWINIWGGIIIITRLFY